MKIKKQNAQNSTDETREMILSTKAEIKMVIQNT